ncbi:30S ribosomal protein S3 [Candidatus Gottesmanbacteria bacterium RBG_16_52_11]|uniref:Small ribosomal subunit protein uS3 n=1 Tax=Candidatus Gottesmanbacteria bacterium RBG_16_52_11 TaxID=1798374 RepID=A0A1F5YXY4_9BACT|nr:MAG: 30S ribosomal protein S3 [Candidatus Gottesmanbacteria bacterium RBG_16_52_11]
MGQKIHPKGFRLGPLYTWTSRWYAPEKYYKDLLLSDVRLRSVLRDRLKNAGLAQVDIERSINKIKIILYVSRPGVVIGRGGSGLEDIKKFITRFISRIELSQRGPQKSETGKTKIELVVEPVKEPNLNAQIVATNIAEQIAKRLPHKRVTLQAVDRVMSAGAKGVKVVLAGRIAGAEIARREKYQQGSVPLSTLREDIDYAETPSLTKSGYVGVKVWICRKPS